MKFLLFLIGFVALCAFVPETPFILLVLVMTGLFMYGIYAGIVGEERFIGG